MLLSSLSTLLYVAALLDVRLALWECWGRLLARDETSQGPLESIGFHPVVNHFLHSIDVRFSAAIRSDRR